MKSAFLALFLALVPISAVGANAPWKVPQGDYGGAVPLNLNEWYSFTDYPEDAVDAGEQGYVTVGFTITTEGQMTNCHVLRSSGFKRLDAVPCKVLPARARFAPAKDATGAPRITQGTSSMSFWTQ